MANSHSQSDQQFSTARGDCYWQKHPVTTQTSVVPAKGYAHGRDDESGSEFQKEAWYPVGTSLKLSRMGMNPPNIIAPSQEGGK